MAVSAAVSIIDTTSTRKLDESTRIRNGKGMNMAKTKVKSPAEILYDEQNPLFSTRTRPEVMAAEQKMMLATGMNRRDLLESLYRGQNEKFDAAINQKVEEKVQLMRADILDEGKSLGRVEASKQISEQKKRISDDQKALELFVSAHETIQKHGVIVNCKYCERVMVLENNLPDMMAFQQEMQRRGCYHYRCHEKWLFQTGQITWDDLPGFPEEFKKKPPAVRVGQQMHYLD